MTKKMGIKEKMVVTAMAATVLLGTISAAAQSISVGGGTWTYGVGKTVYSRYYHPTKIHGSSVENGNGWTDTDYNRVAGATSSASVTSVDDEVDHAYYCIGKR